MAADGRGRMIALVELFLPGARRLALPQHLAGRPIHREAHQRVRAEAGQEDAIAVTIGEEYPCGRSVFQITFRVGPNSAGSPVVSESPEPFGPRKRDQLGSGRSRCSGKQREGEQDQSKGHHRVTG